MERKSLRILFSSDLHGDLAVYERFSTLLADYDLGILAGDLMDEYATISEAQFYGVRPDDWIEELLDADADPTLVFERGLRVALADPNSENIRTLLRKRDHLLRVLGSSGRPVLLVRGNHDVVAWPDRGPVIHLEDRRWDHQGWSFFGVGDTFVRAQSTWKFSHRYRRLVPPGCVLVSHSPPYGSLDWARGFAPRRRKVGGSPIGNRALRKLAAKVHPTLHLFGHVHGGFGVQLPAVNGAYPTARAFWELLLSDQGVETMMVR